MGPVRQSTIRRTIRSIHMCVHRTVHNCSHTILHRTDLIIFRLTRQTITTAPMMSILRVGMLVSWNYSQKWSFTASAAIVKGRVCYSLSWWLLLLLLLTDEWWVMLIANADGVCSRLLQTLAGISFHNDPPPSNRHYRSNGDCLEGKRENYQICFVQYCVQQLYTVQCAHIWTDLTVLWIGFLSHWAHFTVLRFIFVYVCKCVVIVTRWGGPGGIEAYP